MRARRLIAGSSYGPEVLKVIGQAFDEAWAEIAHHFPRSLEMQAARLRLASVILAMATEDSRDSEKLKKLALEAMALKYRRLRAAGDPAMAETRRSVRDLVPACRGRCGRQPHTGTGKFD